MDGVPVSSASSAVLPDQDSHQVVRARRNGHHALLLGDSTTLYESLQCGLPKQPAAKPEQAEWITQKRVGFYRLRGQLGSGNFSKVKFGVHLLTNGVFSV